jgi:hypothetical protein
MARTVVCSLNEVDSTFNLLKLDRERLYGSRKRIVLDGLSQPCTKASLTVDGLYLLQTGMTAQGYFDESGRWLQKSELVGLDAEGNTLELKPSTLGVAQKLRLVQPSELLTHAVTSVYILEATSLDATLAGCLDSGDIFAFDFNYSADYRTEKAFLLKNSEGVFALICEPTHPKWCEPGSVTVLEDSAEVVDELDFDMF